MTSLLSNALRTDFDINDTTLFQVQEEVKSKKDFKTVKKVLFVLSTLEEHKLLEKKALYPQFIRSPKLTQN